MKTNKPRLAWTLWILLGAALAAIAIHKFQVGDFLTAGFVTIAAVVCAAAAEKAARAGRDNARDLERRP